MAIWQGEERVFVISWRDKKGQNRFFIEPAWVQARDRFEQVLEVLDPDCEVEPFRARYGTVVDTGIVPSSDRPIGFFRCAARSGRDLFAIARGCGRWVPVLGSRRDLEARLATLSSSLQVDRYFPQDVTAFEAEQRIPPSDMKRTRKAEECLSGHRLPQESAQTMKAIRLDIRSTGQTPGWLACR